MTRKKAYVCAPYSGTEEEMRRNRELTIDRCRMLFDFGLHPIAPQIYYPAFLDETNPDHREFGLAAGIELLADCDEIVVFGMRVTDGMLREINYAEQNGIRIVFLTDDTDAEKAASVLVHD